MFFESSTFPFISILETNWLLIKQEFEQVQQEKLIDWPEKNLYNKGWKVFGLYAFGNKLAENCQLCPQTTQLIESIPGITTAGFSCLASGTKISPHVGYSDQVLRCHLGLIVPNGCALKVGNQTKSWQEGKCFTFDDTVEHEAWNQGMLDRVVLLVDFLKPQIKLSNKSQLKCPEAITTTVQKIYNI